ncbi:MAG: hypothetical protein ACK5HL_04430 [Bacilli bacterium]
MNEKVVLYKNFENEKGSLAFSFDVINKILNIHIPWINQNCNFNKNINRHSLFSNEKNNVVTLKIPLDKSDDILVSRETIYINDTIIENDILCSDENNKLHSKFIKTVKNCVRKIYVNLLENYDNINQLPNKFLNDRSITEKNPIDITNSLNNKNNFHHIKLFLKHLNKENKLILNNCLNDYDCKKLMKVSRINLNKEFCEFSKIYSELLSYVITLDSAKTGCHEDAFSYDEKNFYIHILDCSCECKTLREDKICDVITLKIPHDKNKNLEFLLENIKINKNYPTEKLNNENFYLTNEIACEHLVTKIMEDFNKTYIRLYNIANYKRLRKNKSTHITSPIRFKSGKKHNTFLHDYLKSNNGSYKIKNDENLNTYEFVTPNILENINTFNNKKIKKIKK